MKRFAAVLAVAVLFPFAVSAQSATQSLLQQIELLQQQIANLQGQVTCDLPKVTMKKGSAGPDVTLLQQFLARDAAVFPDASITGYYGTLTELAVQRWQKKNNIVSGGTPATTGYGVVGKKTLAAMQSAWCFQSALAPVPFTPPKAPATTTTIAKPLLPQIIFTSPSASTTVEKGNSVFASWQSILSPSSTTVRLSLKNKSGATLGVVKENLTSVGSYYWKVPLPPKPSNVPNCSGTSLDCLSQLGQIPPECTSLCTIADGLYKFYAELMRGNTVLAHAESRIFSVGGVGLSTQDISNAGTAWNINGGVASSSYLDSFLSNTSWTPTAIDVPGQSCIYSGVPYSHGISLEINCADVTVYGQGCGVYGGMKLTCRNGAWVDSNGVAQSVRNVTTTNTAGSCMTPWGSTIVGNGNQVPYEPFFTQGQYVATGPIRLMKCSSGNWLTCDTVGNNCR